MGEVLSCGDSLKFLLYSCPRSILGLLEIGEKSGDYPSKAPQIPHIFPHDYFPSTNADCF